MFFSCRDSCSYSSDRWRGLHRRSEEGMKPHQSDEKHGALRDDGVSWLNKDGITELVGRVCIGLSKTPQGIPPEFTVYTYQRRRISLAIAQQCLPVAGSINVGQRSIRSEAIERYRSIITVRHIHEVIIAEPRHEGGRDRLDRIRAEEFRVADVAPDDRQQVAEAVHDREKPRRQVGEKPCEIAQHRGLE